MTSTPETADTRAASVDPTLVEGLSVQAEDLTGAMLAIANLAGWRTVPHADDFTVVRLAIRTARDRHDPNQGGYREVGDLIDDIEARWLDHALTLPAR